MLIHYTETYTYAQKLLFPSEWINGDRGFQKKLSRVNWVCCLCFV